MPTRTRLREAVRVDPLAGIQVIDNPYAALAADNPYAARSNPYAARSNPYAIDNPYAAAAGPREPVAAAMAVAAGRAERRRRPAPRRVVKRTVVILPGSSRPTMLWTPVGEYFRCFEEWYPDCALWQCGDWVDFTEAAESAHLEWDDGGYSGLSLEDRHCLGAVPVASETETFDVDYMYTGFDSPLWPDLIGAIAALRAELVEDPTPIASLWDNVMANTIREWVGGHAPSEDGVLAAIATDSMNGAGGAALDYCTWCRPEAFGRSGAEIREYVSAIEQDEYVCTEPVENFIFDPASLHPETRAEKYFNLYGEYEVDRVAYHSDPKGQGAVGFRSLFMRPRGVPVRPDFSG